MGIVWQPVPRPVRHIRDIPNSSKNTRLADPNSLSPYTGPQLQPATLHRPSSPTSSAQSRAPARYLRDEFRSGVSRPPLRSARHEWQTRTVRPVGWRRLKTCCRGVTAQFPCVENESLVTCLRVQSGCTSLILTWVGGRQDRYMSSLCCSSAATYRSAVQA